MKRHLASGQSSLASIARVSGGAYLDTYKRRFGGFTELCRQLGIVRENLLVRSANRKHRMQVRAEFMERVRAGDPLNISIVAPTQRTKSILRLRRRGTVAVVGCHFYKRKLGQPRWLVCPAKSDKKKDRPYLLCCFDEKNEQYERFYLLKKLKSRTNYTLRSDDEWLKIGIRIRKPGDLYEAVGRLKGHATRTARLSVRLGRGSVPRR